MTSQLWSFEAIKRLLVDQDKFNQADGARQVFDEWYRIAKLFVTESVNKKQMLACTNDCLHVLFMTYAPGEFTKRTIDYYAISALMKEFRNILNIFTTKPKFHVLCNMEEFARVMKWLQDEIIPQLVLGTKNDNMDSISRIEYSESITRLLQFGVHLNEVFPQVYPNPAITVYMGELFRIAFNKNENLSLRQSVLQAVSTMIQIDCVKMIVIVSPMVCDTETCSVLWSLHVLESKEAVEVIQMSIRQVVKKNGAQALSMYYNSLNDCISRVFGSLATQPQSIVDAVLYHTCITVSTLAQLTTSPSGKELYTVQEEVIAGKVLLQSLTHYYPNSPYILDFLFSTVVVGLFPVPSIISPYIDLFNDESYINYIFPYLYETVSAMSVAGVSGNEDDQDVINLLRDICIHILNDSLRAKDYELGHMMFSCLLMAMRRGYIETERFSEITANVIAYYFIKPEEQKLVDSVPIKDSTTWIEELFRGKDDRHRDMRAIKEVIGVVLGMKEIETTINSQIDADVSEIVIEEVIRVHDIEMLQIFRDILLTAALDENSSITPNLQAKLLYSINNWVVNDSKDITLVQIKTIFLPLLRSLTPIISPSLVFLLLEVTIRVLLLCNDNSGGGGGNAAYHQDKSDVYVVQNPIKNVLMDDSLLCGILEKAPQSTTAEDREIYYTSTSVIAKCLEQAGVETRKMMASLFPYYCLLDEDISVRQLALVSIKDYPELIYKYYDDIFLSLEMGATGDDAHIGIGMADLLISAGPVLTALATHSIQFVPQCLIYLIEGLNITRMNDLLNEPNDTILKAIRSIYASTNPRYVPSILSAVESNHAGYTNLLTKYCSEWIVEDEAPAMPAAPVAQPKESRGLHNVLKNSIYNKSQPQEDTLHQKGNVNYWELYWSRIQEVQQKGPIGLIESLSYVNTMRLSEVDPAKQQILYNYLMTTLLPGINAYFLPTMDQEGHFLFTSVFIQNIDAMLRVIALLESVCPLEAEYLLHISALMGQLREYLIVNHADVAVIDHVTRQEQEQMKLLASLQAREASERQSRRHQDSAMSSMASFIPDAQSAQSTQSAPTRQIPQFVPEPINERGKGVDVESVIPDISTFSNVVSENHVNVMEKMGMCPSLRRINSKASIQGLEVETIEEQPSQVRRTDKNTLPAAVKLPLSFENQQKDEAAVTVTEEERTQPAPVEFHTSAPQPVPVIEIPAIPTPAPVTVNPSPIEVVTAPTPTVESAYPEIPTHIPHAVVEESEEEEERQLEMV